MDRNDPDTTRPRFTRRTLLRGTGLAVTGAASSLLFGCGGERKPSSSAKEEPPPEVTSIRLPEGDNACFAPLLMAEEFLHEEGFTKVFYVPTKVQFSRINQSVADGVLDLTFNFLPAVAIGIDLGSPIIGLAGAHVGCARIIARENVGSLADLRGKKVGIPATSPERSDEAFAASLLQYVGLRAGRDFEIVPLRDRVYPQALLDAPFPSDVVDAVVLALPDWLVVRDAGKGRVILDTAVDRPWSQYLCCMIITHREFLEQHPIATKRALRAVLRGIDSCVREPERAAAALFATHTWKRSYEQALESIRTIPFDAWRSHNPDDSLRFYSLRLREAGFMNSTPDEIISRGTDFRIFNELKRELALAPFQQPPRAAAQFNCDIDGVPRDVPLAVAATNERLNS